MNDTFFAPSNEDALDALLASREADLADMRAVKDYLTTDQAQNALSWFAKGYEVDKIAGRNGSEPTFHHNHHDVKIGRLLDIEAATRALDAHYWQRALSMTDVMEFTPAKQRDEWYDLIRNHDTAPFDAATARPTINALLAGRMESLTNMVDGIFFGLSREHVTNRPEGFGKRFILGYAFQSGSFRPGADGSLIHDLRTVVAKLLKREPVKEWQTRSDAEHWRARTGEWHSVDGNAFRVRTYLKGTAHFEVHPVVARMLNNILATKYPNAIPASFREKPKREKKIKDFQLMDEILPLPVREYLRGCEFNQHSYRHDGVTIPGNRLSGPYDDKDFDKHVKQRAADVLSLLGGVKQGPWWVFDYHVGGVLKDVVASGAVPDSVSHQYFPTPEDLGAEAAEWLGPVADDDQCLEPSAGQGGLAQFLPQDRTLCVEASRFMVDVLKTKGYTVEHDDFLRWVKTTDKRFDKILMNPPFSEGRAEAHVRTAAGLLSEGGVLVAIVPASHVGREIDGCISTWSEPKRFPGVSIEVVIWRVE